jgi:2,5-diketo-D-gluconate reductase A
MAHDVPRIRLNDGNEIPQLGLGVWQVPQDITARVVKDGIESGYRMIDTAEGYQNEEGVGRAINGAGVPRTDLWITSKLRSGAHERDVALRAFDETMRKLGLDQIDMFLIHWPVPARDKYTEAWKTLVELRDQGRIRSIGVSNFNQDHLERIIGETGVTPAVNQIELHPRYQQRDKRDDLKAKGIALQSYSPLGSGSMLKDPTIAAIAQKHGKSTAQVMIRWQLDQGIIVIPKSNKTERIKQNFDVFGFTLDDEDKRRIDALDDPRHGKVGGDPATNNNLF